MVVSRAAAACDSRCVSRTSAISGTYKQCQCCLRKFIPEVVLASCEPPHGLPYVPLPRATCHRLTRRRRYAQQPQAFDVHVIRKISPALEGEALALHLNSIITFMEYDMYSLIIAKLRYAQRLIL